MILVMGFPKKSPHFLELHVDTMAFGVDVGLRAEGFSLWARIQRVFNLAVVGRNGLDVFFLEFSRSQLVFGKGVPPRTPWQELGIG